MKRIARWVFNGMAILLLLLCAATIAIRVRSYRRADVIFYNHFQPAPQRSAETWHEWIVLSRNGGLQFMRQTDLASLDLPNRLPRLGLNSGPAGAYPPFFGTLIRGQRRSFWQRAGFEVRDSASDVSPDEIFQGVIVPHWFFAAVVGLFGVIMALVAIRRGRRRRWQLAGCCPACGYDLTGNTSGICPECGTKVEAMTATA